MDKLKLTRTVKALADFDAAHGPHDPGHNSELAKAVAVAFAADTADRNDPATCAALVHPGCRKPRGGSADLSFVRRMVELYRSNEMTTYHRQQLRRAYSDVRMYGEAMTTIHTNEIDENAIPVLLEQCLVQRDTTRSYGCRITQDGVDYVRDAWPGMTH